MPLATTYREDLGYYLRHYRAALDLTQMEAASRFGVNPSYWSLLESNRRTPSPKLAKALADATGAPLEIMLNLRSPKRRPIARKG